MQGNTLEQKTERNSERIEPRFSVNRLLHNWDEPTSALGWNFLQLVCNHGVAVNISEAPH